MMSRAEQGGEHRGRPDRDGHRGAGGGARDDAAELLELLHTASRRMRREAVADCAEPPGTKPGQVRILRFLAHASGPVRAADVAAAMELAPRSVTSKVDQAEADGYVRRVPDPSDRRARLFMAVLLNAWLGLSLSACADETLPVRLLSRALDVPRLHLASVPGDGGEWSAAVCSARSEGARRRTT